MSIVIFTGVPLLVYLARIYFFSARSKLLNSDWKVILLTIVIGSFLTPAEKFGIEWGAWTYNPAKTFNIYILGAAIETYLFTVLVTLLVSIATILFARRDDRSREVRNRKHE